MHTANDFVLLRLHVQVWYDDPISTAMKYNRTLGLGMTVIGMWVAGATGFDAQATAAMWAAIPTPPKMHAAHSGSGGKVQLELTETAVMKSDFEWPSGSLQLGDLSRNKPATQRPFVANMTDPGRALHYPMGPLFLAPSY
jgi:hypothetical protein